MSPVKVMDPTAVLGVVELTPSGPAEWDVQYKGAYLGTIEHLPRNGGWLIHGATVVLGDKTLPYPPQGSRADVLRLLLSWHRSKG